MDYQQLRPGSLSTSIGISAVSEGQAESHCLALFLTSFLVVAVIFNQVQVFSDLFEPRERYVTCQALVFLVFTILYWCATVQHRMLRSKGYVQFYVKASKLVRVTFLIVSYATCLICTLYSYYEDWTTVHTFFNKDTLMRALGTLENLFILGCVAAYVRFRYVHLLQPHITVETKPGIQQLEAQVRALTEELNGMHSQMTQLPRNSESSLRLQQSTPQSREDSEINTSAREARALKADNDRLRQTYGDQLEAAQRAQELLRKEYFEAAELVSEQKKKIRQLTKDNEQLTILVEVHKEGNASVQKMIDSLTGHAGYSFSPDT